MPDVCNTTITPAPPSDCKLSHKQTQDTNGGTGTPDRCSVTAITATLIHNKHSHQHQQDTYGSVLPQSVGCMPHSGDVPFAQKQTDKGNIVG
eukprot:g48226.t1